MKKIPCLYAIVRFAPFVETEEFANVGIILLAPAQRYFGFRLLGRRYARVIRFFEELEPRIFSATMRNLREELVRAAAMLQKHGFDRGAESEGIDLAKGLFAEIIRPRETIIKFSEPRAVLAADLQMTLEELYGFYVERNFATQEYQETVMNKGLRKWFSEARLGGRFHLAKLGDDTYKVVFPFVEGEVGHPVKAIKPLYLAQDDPTRIIDHGGQWVLRVTQLRKRNRLPQGILFAVQGPDEKNSRFQAYEEVVDELRQANVTILPYADKERILSFAAGS
ncbi:MAG: DUF3037 domain-containing protein [Acidithiobacillus sp.]